MEDEPTKTTPHRTSAGETRYVDSEPYVETQNRKRAEAKLDEWNDMSKPHDPPDTHEKP